MTSPFASDEIFLGRQPILDRRQALLGYELLFRSGPENEAEAPNTRRATADVVCKAYAELGLADALGSNRAFINVDAELLFDDALRLLPAQSVVLQLDAATARGEGVLQRCRELKGDGYEFSIAIDRQASEDPLPLASIATYLKVDVEGASPAELQQLTGRLRKLGCRLLAGRVESAAAHQHCMALHFDFFQGYFFARPTVVEGRKLDTSTRGVLHLIDLLRSEAALGPLETAFKQDPGLTVNLLRLVNAVAMGMRVPITSVRHAITVLGRAQLLRWLQLLMFSVAGGSGIATNPLMQHAALRGYFMEVLAQRAFPLRRDIQEEAFLTGLMSLMPAALGMSMTSILAEIAVAPEVRQALSRQEGKLGLLLALTERYDGNEINETAGLLVKFGGDLSFHDLGECLAETIDWVRRLCTEA